MGRKITILFQVNAGIWFQLLENLILKILWKECKVFPRFFLSCFCLSSPRPLGFLNTLCAWGIHQTQDREAQAISIPRCTSRPWWQLLARSCAHSPVPKHYLCLTHPFLPLFLFISLFPSGNHLPWHAFSSSHLHVSCYTNSSIDFTTR